MFWLGFGIGIVLGAVLGFGFGVVFLIPVLDQVSELEDMLMHAKVDLRMMKERMEVHEVSTCGGIPSPEIVRRHLGV